MNNSAPRLLLAAGAIMALGLTACTSGSAESAAAGATAGGDSGCADVVATAQKAIDAASKTDSPWDGPASGPKAAAGKTLVYVAQSMTNPGVAGVAKGLQEAAATIGWNVKVIDGLGTPAGIQSAFSQALTTKPDGIVIGGFDPKTTAAQVAEANSAKIPLAAWQALSTPGPSTDPCCSPTSPPKLRTLRKSAPTCHRQIQRQSRRRDLHRFLHPFCRGQIADDQEGTGNLLRRQGPGIRQRSPLRRQCTNAAGSVLAAQQAQRSLDLLRGHQRRLLRKRHRCTTCWRRESGRCTVQRGGRRRRLLRATADQGRQYQAATVPYR